ncbi:hypothetical protein DVH24_030928 [Malus domestica]|uniref:Uncharacterized protein n=1 Tax=Malus domestica TaxID=3750 RepID=A0A498HGK9_MALDO|nr:hypothetical protein DVH24_030928 [Malus domestica]
MSAKTKMIYTSWGYCTSSTLFFSGKRKTQLSNIEENWETYHWGSASFQLLMPTIRNTALTLYTFMKEKLVTTYQDSYNLRGLPFVFQYQFQLCILGCSKPCRM